MDNYTPKTSIFEETQPPWQTDYLPFGCPNCRRVFLVPPDIINTTCPLCRRAKLDPQPARLTTNEPEKLLPFQVEKNQLYAIFNEFTSNVWLKPEDFNAEILLKRTRPVFWPMWLVDSDVDGHWQMEAGFDYQVQSSKEVYSGGQWQSRKEIENRIRWEPRLGTASIHVDNIRIPALEEHHNRHQITGTYPLDQANDFDPQQLGIACLEVPDLSPREAWRLARPQVQRELGQICTSASGAEHQRDFAIKADYRNLHWTQFLLPMYTTHYMNDEGQPQILVVNGRSGSIYGPRLASRKRGLHIAGILAGVAGAIFIIALIGLLLAMVFPLAGLIASFLGVLGLGVGIAAIVPAVWPGQWNRRQEEPRIITRTS
ncbi:MAG: phage holin family protein [Chloroflexota bacterium]|nr:phage holin family protein [Chloroflexota bacterium]